MEVRKLRAELDAHRQDLVAQGDKVVVLEQKVKEQGRQMDDWVRSGIEHRTQVNVELKNIKDLMSDLKSLPVSVATISTKLDELNNESFWDGPNVRWVVIGFVVTVLLVAGVNNADKVADVIEVLSK